MPSPEALSAPPHITPRASTPLPPSGARQPRHGAPSRWPGQAGGRPPHRRPARGGSPPGKGLQSRNLLPAAWLRPRRRAPPAAPAGTGNARPAGVGHQPPGQTGCLAWSRPAAGCGNSHRRFWHPQQHAPAAPAPAVAPARLSRREATRVGSRAAMACAMGGASAVDGAAVCYPFPTPGALRPARHHCSVPAHPPGRLRCGSLPRGARR